MYYLSLDLSIYILKDISIYLLKDISFYLFIDISIYLFMDLSIYFSSVIHLSIYLYLRTSRALRPCTYPYLSTTTIYDLRVGTSYLVATMYARPEHVVELRESHHVLQVEALREAHLWAGYGSARSKRGERPRSPRTAASQEAKGFLV